MFMFTYGIAAELSADHKLAPGTPNHSGRERVQGAVRVGGGAVADVHPVVLGVNSVLHDGPDLSRCLEHIRCALQREAEHCDPVLLAGPLRSAGRRRSPAVDAGREETAIE